MFLSMEELLKVGQIVKPQGIKGEVKVIPLTDDVTRFLKLKTVYIDGTIVKVGGVKIASDSIIMSLIGVNDRNSAENFRGKFLCVEKDPSVLKENSYFVSDLENSLIFDEKGEKIGKIISVTSAKTDYLTVLTIDKRTMRFPFLKRVIKEFDAENKKLVVIREKLSEIECYED